jgi:hypothetical protein
MTPMKDGALAFMEHHDAQARLILIYIYQTHEKSSTGEDT